MPPACQEPVRSGFPLGSFGVGAFGSGAAPPPPPPAALPTGPLRRQGRADDAKDCRRARRAPNCCACGFLGAIRCLFIAESSLSSLLDAVRNRHDDVDLADLGHLRTSRCERPRRSCARRSCLALKRLDLEQRIVEVRPFAVDELGRVRPVRHHHALGQIVDERRCRRRTRHVRDRERDDSLLVLFPRQRRRRLSRQRRPDDRAGSPGSGRRTRNGASLRRQRARPWEHRAGWPRDESAAP